MTLYEELTPPRQGQTNREECRQPIRPKREGAWACSANGPSDLRPCPRRPLSANGHFSQHTARVSPRPQASRRPNDQKTVHCPASARSYRGKIDRPMSNEANMANQKTSTDMDCCLGVTSVFSKNALSHARGICRLQHLQLRNWGPDPRTCPRRRCQRAPRASPCAGLR